MKCDFVRETGKAAVCILLLFAVVLCLSVPARADGSGTCGEGLSWTLSGGVLSIGGTGAMTDFSDKNMPPWYEQASEIVTVSIGEGVTRIGTLAFYGCTLVQRAALPTTVTAIGDRAFMNCGSLRYLNLPDGLTRIGESAFESCEALNGIRLPSGLGVIGDFAFYRCTSLSTISIPSSVWRLGAVAFACCTGLVEARILCPISRLPDWTFYGCTALSMVSLPETITEVGELCFFNCDNLETISYEGSSESVITESLDASSEQGSSASIVEEGSAGSGIYTEESISEDGYLAVASVTTVEETENSIITVTEKSEYTFSVDGHASTIEEAAAAMEEGAEYRPSTYGMVTTGVGVGSETEVFIQASVDNSQGWTELEKTIQAAGASQTEGKNIQVSVQIPDTTVSGEDLRKTAANRAELSVTAADGTTWLIDQSVNRIRDYREESYDLSLSVSEVADISSRIGIGGETGYEVVFQSDVDFQATVGVPLKVEDGRKTATLYQKVGSETTAVQSVVVDDNGIAWFSVASVDKRTDYYVVVNTPEVEPENAVIPASLARDFNLDSTLIGADGTQYKVTGRSSRWGISGKQFAIYAAIGLGALVFLVTLIMITLNKLAKSKAKYAVPPPDSSGDIDEEALRLELMKELLEEKTEKKE